MRLLRRFGILALGLVLVAAGTVGYCATFPRTSFGWTAYAPLTRATFTPEPNTWLIGVAVVGLVLVAGWVGHLIGRRGAR